MNYLAHAYLSFNDPQILLGNLISDFVKGKSKYSYPPQVLKGIDLHRAIDGFTDIHPATRLAKTYFKPTYGLYSGAFVDIVYDHFLALDPQIFPRREDLAHFAQATYEQIRLQQPIVPERFRLIFRAMYTHNWLENYRLIKGIHSSFQGLVHRARYLDDSLSAYRIFESRYFDLAACYRGFFPDVNSFARDWLGRPQ